MHSSGILVKLWLSAWPVESDIRVLPRFQLDTLSLAHSVSPFNLNSGAFKKLIFNRFFGFDSSSDMVCRVCVCVSVWTRSLPSQ